MKPDLIITQIKHCDYPIFRGFLVSHRDWFDKVIIYFSEHNRFPYFDHFIHDSLNNLDITWVDPVFINWGVEDWRNVSTNELLKYSKAKWVCSIEQDWFVKNWSNLWDAVQEASKTADYMGWWQENNKYIHPSFWFSKRELLEKTRKDFSAKPPHDHFGLIYEDVKKLGGKVKTLQDMGLNCSVDPNADCYHLGGVNQNYLEGLKDNYVFHREDIFYVYNWWSMKCNVLQSPEFMELMQRIDKKLSAKFPEINPETSEWKEFFK